MSFGSSASYRNSSTEFSSSRHTVSLKKCPHPNCDKPIDRCLLVEKLPDRFVLFCSACERKFTEIKSEESSLTTGGRKYFKKEAVESLDQLGVCDLIQYEVSVQGETKKNFAICTRIDRESKTVRVVKLTLNDEDMTVVEKEVREEVLLQKATVYRFMPLDCCSKDETLSRAQQSAGNGEDWLKTNIGESLSFEKFANWLKTGEAEDLILRVRGVISKCPTCNEPLYRSFLLSREPLQLFCTACSGRYEVRGSEEQVAKLSSGWGKPHKTEKLSSIEQLGPADVLKKDLKGFTGAMYTHHMICVNVDTFRNSVQVIHLNGMEDGMVLISNHTLAFDDLKKGNPKVVRYLPLDCLPGELTLEVAEKFVQPGGTDTWEPNKYCVATNNCQHFATYCKTGQRSSEDVQSTIKGLAFSAASAAAVGFKVLRI